LSFVKVEEKSRLSGPPVWGVQNRYFRRTRTFDRAYCLNYQIQTQQRSLLYTGFRRAGYHGRRKLQIFRHARPLRAIHLAAAIRLQADLLIAYDAELLAAAVDAGLNVLSPGGRV
jgi:hypothetical protein